MKKQRIILPVCILIVMLALLCSSCSDMGGSYYGAYDVGGEYYRNATPTQGDNFTHITDNPFVSTTETLSSFISMDANTASYPLLRRLINEGQVIDPDAVRAEEILNYFSFDYEEPQSGDILALNASIFDNPYNPQTKLLSIGLSAQKIKFAKQRNNVVFLIDTSGSMYGSDRLGLIQSSFKMLTDHLNADDRVSIVTYAGDDRVALEGAYGSEKKKINAVIEDLEANGSTAGAAGINTAYAIAEKYFIKGGNNRIILATDGDFNVGISDTDQLKALIQEKSRSGVYFSVFGVGYGNWQAEKMETLALNGNGTYSYLDSLTEARRALVEQIGGTMLTVAKDVKAGITFNPEYVSSFRLIGYETKQITQEEFNDTEKDAGELGSGHTVTVVYEIIPAKEFTAGEKVATVDIHYKPTENSETQETGQNLTLALDVLGESYHERMTDDDIFVSAIVEFTLLLRNSEYKANADINALIERLNGLQLSDPYKQEFVQLVKTYKEKYNGGK